MSASSSQSTSGLKFDAHFQQYPAAYCMNVHPTTSLEQLCENVEQRAAAVGRELKARGCDRQLGVGLWFPSDVARQLRHWGNLNRLKSCMEENQLVAHTINGFPFGNFHSETVKYDVYRPTWAEPSRLEYTIDLIEILHQLLPADRIGSISTLPLGWPGPDNRGTNEHAFLEACAANLHKAAEHLRKLEDGTGRSISLCIEPEPGCLLSTSDDVVEFFSRWLRGTTKHALDKNLVNRIQVCHDVCHAAVMFESQSDVINKLADAGISIGKVQISSAPRVVKSTSADPACLMNELQRFDERRYLHQTFIEGVGLIDDLGMAMEKFSLTDTAEWRVHFHVPVFLRHVGALETTQSDIFDACRTLRDRATDSPHFEIETYAWSVLPRREQFESLEAGIAHELIWFYDQIASLPESTE